MTVYDWITWGVPFLSGIAGVYTGLRVGIVRLEANYCNLRQKIDSTEKELNVLRNGQVVINRCDKYRLECQARIEKTLDRIEENVERNREYVGNKFSEIAVYMAKHNGD